MNYRVLLATSLLLSATYTSMAQEIDDYTIQRSVLTKNDIRTEDIDGNKMVINAGRSDKSVDRLPVTVYVVTHDEIMANGYVTLCDVLKRVPGIRVSQPQSGEFGEAFVQRGLTGNIYTKILINGFNIKPSGPEGMPLGANIPIRQAERIEIIYGPASASYGNDACSGVINIVTRHGSEKNYASGDIMMGDGGYSYTNFEGGGKFGHGNHVVDYSIYGSNLNYKNMPIDHGERLFNPWYYLAQGNRDGEVFTLPDGTRVMPADMNETYVKMLTESNSVFAEFMQKYKGTPTRAQLCDIPEQATQLGIEMRYKGLHATYNMMRRMDMSSLGQSPTLWQYNDASAHIGEYIHRVTLGGTFTLGNLTSSTNILLNHYRMDKDSYFNIAWEVGPQYQWSASDDIEINQDFSLRLTEGLKIYAGLSTQSSGVLPATCITPYQFDFDSYKWFSTKVDYEDPAFGKFGINPYKFAKHATYIQADYDFWDNRAQLTGGARLDHNTLYGSVVNPRIAGLLKINENLNIRASQGYSYKEPSAENMYYCLGIRNRQIDCINYEHIDNPDLNPERISSTELGIRYLLNTKKTGYSYLEVVMYTMKVKEQLTRTWIPLDTDTHPGMGAANNRTHTRVYKNEENGEIDMKAIQAIVVLKDLAEAIKLNVTGSMKYSTGHELVAAAGVSDSRDDYQKLDYVRMVPKYYAQLSIDMTLMKNLYLRADNIISSKFARKYFHGYDNEYFWYPRFVDIDLTLGLKINDHLSMMLKCNNALNQKYGGIDSKRMDTDLPYNPQMLRRFRIGVTYNF